MSTSNFNPHVCCDWKNDTVWRRRIDKNLHVEATALPDSPVLERFFAGYDRAFVLPDEREEIEGFRRCLELNATWRHSLGRTHCELVAVFSDANGALLGGANFLATALSAHRATPAVAIALNYIFVEHTARGRGLLRRFIATVRSLALDAVETVVGDAPPAIFIEQNDPLRLTAEQCAMDSARSGIDQVDRLAIWAHVGARIVDFPYIQPPLSADQAPDNGLVYAAVDYLGDNIPAWLLHEHLESFFSISVLKGNPADGDATAGSQLAALNARSEPIALLPFDQAIEKLRVDYTGARLYPDLGTLAKQD